MENCAVFTIISKNYLSYARVFTQSFKRFHPKIKVFVSLVDRVDGFFDPKREKFELIEAESLDIKNTKSFFFKYNILELNTAVKPFFIEYLFKKYKFNKVIYFDPDILITNNLKKLIKILDSYSILLIPHITKPINDQYEPGELDILKSGTFNLGFIGLKNTNTTKKFLSWWQQRVYDLCLHKTEDGLFVDQKWIDLVPSLFSDHYILYDPEYNVAYWNLQERKVVVRGKSIRANNFPMRFFHFSGVDPFRLHFVSKHQNRFSLKKNLKHLTPIFRKYSKLLFEHGYKDSIKWPYAYEQFDNGTKIANIIRTIYLNLSEEEKDKFGDPFATSQSSFFNWLNKSRYKVNFTFISNLMYELYKEVPNLKLVFPDIQGRDSRRFVDWFITQAKNEYKIDQAFVKLLENPAENLKPDRNLVFQVSKKIIGKIYYHPVMQANKFILKRIIGSQRYYGIRNLLTSYLWGFQKSGEVIKNGSDKFEFHNFGLNIAGHITAESGTGQAVRSTIQSVRRVRIPSKTRNFEINVYRKKDKTFKDFSLYNPYQFNLIFVNADQVEIFYKYVGSDYFQGKYNIGYWLWEQDRFPAEWINSFKYLDEIWTASSFSVNAISNVSPIPVIRVPLSVNIVRKNKQNLQHHSLPHDRFIFLFVFDFLSVLERKNPVAVIDAYEQAFSKKDNTILLLKTVNSKYNLQAFKTLNSRMKKNKSIRIIDEYFSKDEVNNLINLCDCYVSLHRSEGYGYTIFEAMSCGKPVIATAYSGNMDIMDINNSFPVKYKFKELKMDFGPYKKGTLWADPDVNHATELMRFVYEHQSAANKIGERASLDIKSRLNDKVIGGIIKNRLDAIRRIS